MNPSIPREGSAFSRRRIAGAALAAALWAPVYAPGMMVWGNVASRALGLTPTSLGFALYISYFVLCIIYWASHRPGARRVFDADDVMMSDALAIGEKLRALWALSLGRFLIVYATLFVVLVGLSAIV